MSLLRNLNQKKNVIDLEHDIEIQKELRAYEKYVTENKKRIYQKIILDAIYTLKVSQPILNCCKKINLSTFPHFSGETIGQLLGKQGQHKQFFVNLTKVNLEVDKDNSSAIVLSKYNAIAVHKAEELIKKLLSKPRWSQEKMVQLYRDVEIEFDEKCIENGRKILKEFLEYKKFSDTLAKHAGVLQYIYSFNQNILEHSNEVAQISANIAYQLGLDPLMAKRAGFFHDIGKAIANFEDHVDKGIMIAKDAGLDDYIINAIESHHKKAPPNNPYSVIVQAADKLSAGREGARPRQIELIDKRKNMIQQEIMTLNWIEKVIIKNAGNLIQIFIKLGEFQASKIPALKSEIKAKLRSLNSEYSYNYQIEFKLIYEENFLLDEE